MREETLPVGKRGENLQETAASAAWQLEAISVVSIAARLDHMVSPLILSGVDYGMILTGLHCSFQLRNLLMQNRIALDASFTPYFFWIIPLLYISLLVYQGLYTKRQPFWKDVESLFRISFYATAVTIGVLYFDRRVVDISRIFLVLSGLLSFTFLAFARWIAKNLMVSCGLWQKPMILVGTGKAAELVAGALEEDSSNGYQIVGLIHDDHEALSDLAKRYPYLGAVKDSEAIITASGVRDVVLAVPGIAREQLLGLVYRLQPLVDNVSIVPDLFGLPLINLSVASFFNQRTVILTTRNNLLNVWNHLFKRCFDLSVGCVLLVVILPVLAFIAYLIKQDSPGPVFHAAKRIGKKGKSFNCYKFRSMFVNSEVIFRQYLAENPDAVEEWEKYAKLKGEDPRVTRIGRWLRKYSLDELPQIFNVVTGKMSLVGPRPYLPREQEKMGDYYNTIVQTVPGITGLWQVSGRNDLEFSERLILDAWYVRNWSFWLDINLLFKTVKVVLRRSGAY